MSRKELLEYLIKYPIDFSKKIELINSFNFDSDEELITISNKDIKYILQRFLENQINSNELEEWANFIEGRDDINYSEFNQLIFDLANPILSGMDKTQISKIFKAI